MTTQQPSAWFQDYMAHRAAAIRAFLEFLGGVDTEQVTRYDADYAYFMGN